VDAWLSFCDEHDVDPIQARRPHLDAWARSLELLGLKPRTVARRLSSVSSWHDFLVVEQARATSPAKHVRRPKVGDRGETQGLTRDEMRRLMAAAVKHGSARSFALLSLLAHTGVRVGEALSRDVEHLAHDRGHRILRLERKGGRGGRTVLTAPVVRALDEYLAGRTTGPLFVTKSGRRMDQPEAWRMVRRLAKRAELDGAGEIRPHSLRVVVITGARRRASPWRTCRTLPDMLTLAPHGATTAVAIRSTGMRRMQ
jgi:site-specific recombinase XerD